mmetsp:Transcript_15914/g.38002  ORF Transcript_15914/g.38002 Transcript_15914/m.38002 type:complete len:205 (+) Transcript_15914:284-898(+)
MWWEGSSRRLRALVGARRSWPCSAAPAGQRSSGSCASCSATCASARGPSSPWRKRASGRRSSWTVYAARRGEWARRSAVTRRACTLCCATATTSSTSAARLRHARCRSPTPPRSSWGSMSAPSYRPRSASKVVPVRAAARHGGSTPRRLACWARRTPSWRRSTTASDYSSIGSTAACVASTAREWSARPTSPTCCLRCASPSAT